MIGKRVPHATLRIVYLMVKIDRGVLPRMINLT